jgi:hypothetical protein
MDFEICQNFKNDGSNNQNDKNLKNFHGIVKFI